jgi:hypothetical protein
MWGKRPKPGGKGLRCQILVARGKATVSCERPARRYICEKRSFYLGTVDVCTGHKAAHERQGITMTRMDRRKKYPPSPESASAQGRG